MLTEQERKWLEKRRTKDAPCGACWRWCSSSCKNPCDILVSDYRDAAEFEARAKVIALHIDIEDVPCAHGMTMFCPAKHFKGKGCGNWCRMRMAHLQAEEEMGNERNNA